jgi:hypothetical protein
MELGWRRQSEISVMVEEKDCNCLRPAIQMSNNEVIGEEKEG